MEDRNEGNKLSRTHKGTPASWNGYDEYDNEYQMKEETIQKFWHQSFRSLEW